MKAIKFDIEGHTAFFKNPCINSTSETDMWFSFPHIHKIAIAGIIGALIGKDGYRARNDQTYPSFWEDFKNIKVAIIPSKPIFKKKVVGCANTTGFANQESKFGKSMVYGEQWLMGTEDEPLKWSIYIEDTEEKIFNDICDAIMNGRMVYMPYLGNNHHFCDIKNAELVELKKSDSMTVDSIFILNDDIIVEEMKGRQKSIYIQYNAPIGLEEQSCSYSYAQHILTNRPVRGLDLYADDQANVAFF